MERSESVINVIGNNVLPYNQRQTDINESHTPEESWIGASKKHKEETHFLTEKLAHLDKPLHQYYITALSKKLITKKYS